MKYGTSRGQALQVAEEEARHSRGSRGPLAVLSDGCEEGCTPGEACRQEG